MENVNPRVIVPIYIFKIKDHDIVLAYQFTLNLSKKKKKAFPFSFTFALSIYFEWKFFPIIDIKKGTWKTFLIQECLFLFAWKRKWKLRPLLCIYLTYTTKHFHDFRTPKKYEKNNYFKIDTFFFLMYHTYLILTIQLLLKNVDDIK